MREGTRGNRRHEGGLDIRPHAQGGHAAVQGLVAKLAMDHPVAEGLGVCGHGLFHRLHEHGAGPVANGVAGHLETGLVAEGDHLIQGGLAVDGDTTVAGVVAVVLPEQSGAGPQAAVGQELDVPHLQPGAALEGAQGLGEDLLGQSPGVGASHSSHRRRGQRFLASRASKAP